MSAAAEYAIQHCAQIVRDLFRHVSHGLWGTSPGAPDPFRQTPASARASKNEKSAPLPFVQVGLLGRHHDVTVRSPRIHDFVFKGLATETVLEVVIGIELNAGFWCMPRRSPVRRMTSPRYPDRHAVSHRTPRALSCRRRFKTIELFKLMLFVVAKYHMDVQAPREAVAWPLCRDCNQTTSRPATQFSDRSTRTSTRIVAEKG